MISMDTYKELKQHCVTFNHAYYSLEKLVLLWSRQNKLLVREEQKHLSLEWDKGYPQDYFRFSAPSLMLHRMLTDDKMLKRFQTSQEKFMGSREKQVLTLLRERPAFWCFFTIKEIYDNDIMLIEDLFRGRSHLMHSPALCDQIRRKGLQKKNYLSLMIHNEPCLINIGLLRSYYLSKADMRFYCNFFDDEATLDRVINDHYNDFFTLDKIDSLPPAMYGEHEIRHTWQSFHLEEFDIKRLGNNWGSKHVGNQSRYDLGELDDAMNNIHHAESFSIGFSLIDSHIVRDNTSGEMGLMNNSEIGYALFAFLLRKAYPDLVLPQQPEISIPGALLSHIATLPCSLPWSTFETVITTVLQEKK